MSKETMAAAGMAQVAKGLALVATAIDGLAAAIAEHGGQTQPEWDTEASDEPMSDEKVFRQDDLNRIVARERRGAAKKILRTLEASSEFSEDELLRIRETIAEDL